MKYKLSCLCTFILIIKAICEKLFLNHSKISKIQNVNIQVFPSAVTPGVQPVCFFFFFNRTIIPLVLLFKVSYSELWIYVLQVYKNSFLLHQVFFLPHLNLNFSHKINPLVQFVLYSCLLLINPLVLFGCYGCYWRYYSAINISNYLPISIRTISVTS